MRQEDVEKTFVEIRTLREQADEKEKQLVQQLRDEGLLSPVSAILLSSGISGFGGRDNGQMLEFLVMSELSKSKKEDEK